RTERSEALSREARPASPVEGLLKPINSRGDLMGRIAVIGAGLMGHGIAQIFAGKEWRVSLTDVDEAILSKAVQGIRANLTFLAQNGIGALEDVEPALGRIRTTLSLEEAAADADFVIEAVAE